jgi:hypothetical protein
MNVSAMAARVSMTIRAAEERQDLNVSPPHTRTEIDLVSETLCFLAI